MSPKNIRIGAEIALVLGITGLLLELIQSHVWAVILIALVAVVRLRVWRH